ncbi:MAG: hypothetical protein ACKOKG_07180, partial [Verrucomicrobiota bacterium]
MSLRPVPALYRPENPLKILRDLPAIWRRRLGTLALMATATLASLGVPGARGAEARSAPPTLLRLETEASVVVIGTQGSVTGFSRKSDGQ